MKQLKMHRSKHEKIAIIARRIVLFVLIAALLWLVVQCVQAPITTISKLFNPFDRMEGRVPHEAANDQGRVEFLLGDDGKGVRMSIPSIYVGSKVQDKMGFVWLFINYETLEPLRTEELNSRKGVIAVLYPRRYEDAYTRLDFETLKKNDMLIPEAAGIWKVKVPKGRKETNEWEEKYKLRYTFSPAYGGYYYIINRDSKVSLITCEKKCSVMVGIKDTLRAKLSIHKDEMENLPYITQQARKFINAAIVETAHAN